MMALLLTVCLGFILVSDTLAVAPVITNINPTNAVNVTEDVTTEEQLLTLVLTDADSAASDLFCALGTGSSPADANDKFRVRQDGGTDWIVFTTAGAGYDFNTQNTYTLDVECEDENGDMSEGILYVYLTQNQVPVITNIASGTTTTLSATSAIGNNFFTVTATDAESDQLFYQISSCSPACPFDIYDSGAIVLNADISETTISSYAVTVVVSDERGSSDPQTLTVTITDINNAPVISNLGTTTSVPENQGLGTAIVTTSCTDADAGTTLSYFMSCTPASGRTYIDINSGTGAITTSSTTSINYESLNSAGTTSFACTVTCSDGQQTDTASVTFQITNVNEAPAFEQTAYSITVNEGAGGTALQASAYGVIDPDTGDTATFSMDCGAYDSYFTVDSTTGISSYAGPYDIDDGTRPSSLDCSVTVADSGSLNETVTLSIFIENVNDNTPIFTESDHFWFVSYGASVSTTVGTATATDADIGDFGVLTYSLDQSGLGGTEYFGISTAGLVSVQTSLLTLTEGATYVVPIIATDGGGLTGTGTATIVVVGTTTTSTTTTTDRFRTFFEDTRNVTWFSFCMAVIFAILCFIGIFLTRYLLHNIQLSKELVKCCRCKRKRKWKNWAEEREDSEPEEPPRSPTPEPRTPTPPPPPPPPINKPPYQGFDFWNTQDKNMV